MTKKNLLDLLSQGEGVTIEFKECRNEVASEVYPTVCSFSSRFGGHILMGINDNGESVGVNPNCVKDMRKNFSNMLSNPQKIYPTLYLSAEEYEIDGRIILYVPKSSQVHTCNKITYDRIGEADVDISKSTTQMAELYMRKQADFTEKKLLPYLMLDELDISLMNRVRNLIKSKDPNHAWLKMEDMEIFGNAGLYERDFLNGKEGFILILDHAIDKIQSLLIILLIVSADKEQMVSQSLSITLSRVLNTSFLNPRFLISFQICSIGFISGVYGGIEAISIFSGLFKPFDLCHAAPLHTNIILSFG